MNRELIIQVLNTKFNNDMISKKYETALYKMCETISKQTNTNIEVVYNKEVYDKLGEIMNAEEKEQRIKITSDIFKVRTGTNSVFFEPFKNKRDIENDRMLNPPEVKQGIFQCRKCKSKRTWSYQLQTRSADEPMTNFVTCVECKNRWTC